MSKKIDDAIKRIEAITKKDLQHKTFQEFYTSPLEELGELATEIKIELGIYGNKHKLPDEGIKGEAVDLYICAICMLSGTGISYQFTDSVANKISIHSLLELLQMAAYNLGMIYGAPNVAWHRYQLAQDALFIFFNAGGTIEELEVIMHAKLDKWEKNQV